MKIKKLIYHVKQPCSKCPYTLKQVHTLTNPCPECKLNGYEMYERFQKHSITSGNFDANINKMVSIEGLTPGQIYANIYNASTNRREYSGIQTDDCIDVKRDGNKYYIL